MSNTIFRVAPPSAALCFVLLVTGAIADPTPAITNCPVPSTKASESPNRVVEPSLDSVKVSADRSPGPRSAEVERREQIVRTALTYRGAPYHMGGASSKSGFDCSGFVQAMCAKWGIYLPRAARQQFSSSVGKRVMPYELQTGDLVFFSDTYRRGTSHVGIYIGEGKMIHAATPSQGVIVSDLTEAYLRKHYCGAIRLDLHKLPAAPGEKSTIPGAGITCGKQETAVKAPKLGPLGLPMP